MLERKIRGVTYCTTFKCNKELLGDSILCASCSAKAIAYQVSRFCAKGPNCEDGDCWCSDGDRAAGFMDVLSKCTCKQCGKKLSNPSDKLDDECNSCRRASYVARHEAFEELDATLVPDTSTFDGKVYRIEKNGVGPFRNSDEAVDRAPIALAKSRELATSALPPPDDFGIFDYDGVYAFTSMAALKYYIKDDLLAYLIDKGYSVNEYVLSSDAEHYKIYDKNLQCVFKKKK